MTDARPAKLPPMTALEFAIGNTFRHFFFGLRLALTWLVALLPFLALGYYAGFRNGMPDFRALPPEALAAFALLGLCVLLATVSIAVNWHRLLVLGEKPRRLGWLRLNGPVWKYLFGFLLIGIILALVAASIFALMTKGVPALEPQLATAARPVSIALAVLLGLFGLFTWYRLSSLLPAIAVRDENYTLGTAWKCTRNNRARYLGFTFWLVFFLAIVGALGAGAFFAQKALSNPYATAVAYVLIGLIGWLTLFLITTIATSHYVHFAGKMPDRD